MWRRQNQNDYFSKAIWRNKLYICWRRSWWCRKEKHLIPESHLHRGAFDCPHFTGHSPFHRLGWMKSLSKPLSVRRLHLGRPRGRGASWWEWEHRNFFTTTCSAGRPFLPPETESNIKWHLCGFISMGDFLTFFLGQSCNCFSLINPLAWLSVVFFLLCFSTSKVPVPIGKKPHKASAAPCYWRVSQKNRVGKLRPAGKKSKRWVLTLQPSIFC